VRGRPTRFSDPHWTTARFASACVKCRKRIARGDTIFYYPLSKEVYCEDCGKPEAAATSAAIFDEDMAVNASL
jgi:hypothetical protein